MRRLVVVLIVACSCATAFGAISSLVETVHTPRPQEIEFDPKTEWKKEGSRTARDAGSPSYNFSSITPLSGDNNGFALVHYSGVNSSTIFIVTQRYSGGKVVQSNVWRTTNYGRNYSNDTGKLPGNDVIVNYFYVSLNADKLIFANQKINKLYLTLDRGETYTSKQLHFDPSTLVFHPKIEDSLLGFDAEHAELYISVDFAETWQLIKRNVSLYTWDTYNTDSPIVYLESTDTSGDTFLYVATMSEGRVDVRVFDTELGAIEKISLSLTNEYIFIEKQLVITDTDGEGGLFVSHRRHRFTAALFPVNLEQHYLIVDASEGLALVAVYHFHNLTNLYLSDEVGERFSLSIQNLKGNGLSFWERHIAKVELVKIAGVRGTYIANRLDPSSNSLYYYWSTYTQISYDKGATWRYIIRPAYKADGTLNDNCTLSECFLNLRITQPSRQGVYSKPNALGLIAAHGNAGKYLNANWWSRWFSNVYLSRDGGFSWTEEFNSGAHEYAFLDHGGVVVTVSKYSGYSVYTRTVRYSCTEGLTWVDETIAEQQLYAIGMLTEPGSATLEATIFAKTPGRFIEWLIVQLNFSVLINTTCTEEDYIDWIPSDERQGGQCLLGEKTTYERRKPEVCCYNGRDYQRLVNTSVCPCRIQDFDCEFGYEKLSTDSPCTPSEDTVPQGPPLECPEGSNYTGTLGYRLIPGDKCQGGDYHAYGPRVYLCPIRAPTTLLLTPHQQFYRVGADVEIELSQGFGSRVSTTYLWEFGDGHSQLFTGFDNAKSVSHSYSTPGIYTVSLSASNSAGVNNISVGIDVLEEIHSFSVLGHENTITLGSTAQYSINAYSPNNVDTPLPPNTYNSTWILILNGDTILTITGGKFSYVFGTEGKYSLNVEVENAVSSQISRSYSIIVVGTPTLLSISSITHSSLMKPGQNISFRFTQGSEQDSTTYTVAFGDGDTVEGISYREAEYIVHQYSNPGMYTIVVTARNIAGSNSISTQFTILNEVSSVSITPPHIIIQGLNEVFQGSYTLKYGTENAGTIKYIWSFDQIESPPSTDPTITQRFQEPSTVVVTLTVSNEVSSHELSTTVHVHPMSDDIRLLQDGFSYAVNTQVLLTLNSTDGESLPSEEVVYRWDLGDGSGLVNTTQPHITAQYSCTGDKVVKAFSVDTDGIVITHAVTGTIHIISSLESLTASYLSGTTAKSAMVNFTLTDSLGESFEGEVTVIISDVTGNQWVFSGQMFEVSNGFLPLLLSPLNKYTIYKIQVSMHNPVSRIETQLQLSRVKETDQSIIVTLEWVDIPEGVNVAQWQDTLENSVTQQIIERFHVEEWRLSVTVSIVDKQKYSVFVKLLPTNMTDEGRAELQGSLIEISDFYNSHISVSIPGSPPIPVLSAQISDGSVNTVRVSTVLGVAIGVPVLLLVSMLFIVPLIICSVVFARKYRKVSHAYTRLRQSRASNFTFTQDGLDEDDDEPPVLLQTETKEKFSLDENFKQEGYGNPLIEKDAEM